MKKYSILLLTVVSFIACKSRKVVTDISKSTDKTKTEQESHVVTKTDLTKTDLTKNVKTSSDSSKKIEDENVSIKADSIIYNKATGEIKAKGNVQANFKKHTNTENKINESFEQFKLAQLTLNKTIDSLGKKKENKDVTEFKKSKQSESKSYGEFIIPGIILILIAIIAIKWDSIKKIFSISSNRQF